MHEIKQFMWALCPDTFHGSKNRQLHEAKMHSVRTILCDQCEKNVFRLEYFMLWRSPNMSYLWKSMYWCPNCEKACTGVLFVKRHVLMKMFKVKYEQTQWPQTLCLYACETCGNSYHPLPYKCHICEKCFSVKGILDDHIRKHGGEKLDCRHLCGSPYLDMRDRLERSCVNNPEKGC